MVFEISDDLHAVFHAEVTRQDETYVIELPASTVEQGSLTPGEIYRIGVLDAHETVRSGNQSAPSPTANTEMTDAPVAEGEQLDVVIEDTGDEGDGIARLDPGYIIFVADTDPGDRVRIEITDVTESYAFGEVVEELLDNPAPS
ncbi:MAG: TRAM domain-containing protein [Halobacteriales archaeon]|nr:TRAM domain-containing protein [Halobacteriales archaeon]